MITNAFQGKSLPIYGDGKQQRDWIHVEDNCRGILAVLERGNIGDVYNIGGQDPEENISIARTVLRLTGKPETLLSHVQDRPGHDRRYALSCTKIRSQLGWRPEIPQEDGLRQTIEWYKENSAWVAKVSAGEYLSYYEKYYENRESSLQAIAAGSTSGSDN
jgi:dTDP-glucose 4,6-dehydratase